MQKNVRLTEDCRRGFKLKAINHKINSCQTHIRHFGRFSILAKGLQDENFNFRVFLLLKLLGATKLSELSFCNSPCCSIASGLCSVTNRNTLILNKI